jgi:transcription termination/antitermination protein NusG
MYDIDQHELATGVNEPVAGETIIDDTLMADPEGATEAPFDSAQGDTEVAEGDTPFDSAQGDTGIAQGDTGIAQGDTPFDSAQGDIEVAQGDTTEIAPRKDNRNWFVVHTYSGYENKVKANLERRIHSMGMQDKIFRVLVPMEDEVEFKDGKRKITPKKVFPGYVLVEMIMDDQSWYVVRNTQGVTGFVGSPGPGEKPVPLQDKEVKTILKQMGIEAPKLKIDFKKGDRVKVTSGPFFDFTGVVDEIAPEKERLRALISIFGRETPVELEFFQVEKV